MIVPDHICISSWAEEGISNLGGGTLSDDVHLGSDVIGAGIVGDDISLGVGFSQVGTEGKVVVDILN
jgi:hypothetical protein